MSSGSSKTVAINYSILTFVVFAFLTSLRWYGDSFYHEPTGIAATFSMSKYDLLSFQKYIVLVALVGSVLAFVNYFLLRILQRLVCRFRFSHELMNVYTYIIAGACTSMLY